MFEAIAGAIPVKGSLSMTVTKTHDGRLSVSFLPNFPEGAEVKGAVLSPLTVSGSIDELNTHLAETLSQYKRSVRGFQTNLVEAKERMEREAEKLKKKQEKAKSGSGKTASTTTGTVAKKQEVKQLSLADFAKSSKTPAETSPSLTPTTEAGTSTETLKDKE